MQTYEPLAGSHITKACDEAIGLAKESGNPVSFKFNDIALRVLPDDQSSVLVARWQSLLDDRQRAYRESPAGRKAAAERAETVKRKQVELDSCVEALPKILRADNHLNALVYWLVEIVEPADDVDVAWDSAAVADRLIAAGYSENEYAGHEPEWFNSRERMGRYLLGQAINCMKKGLPPHSITLSFAQKYFAL